MNSRDESLPVKQISDEELVAEAQTGSRRCFDQLVHRYSHRLFYFLRPKVTTDEDTEDLVQETFLNAYRNINRFDLKYKFSTWLYTTAARLAISFYRKKRVNEGFSIFNPSLPDPQEQVIREEDSKNLWNIAQTLQANQYQVLWLRYMEELSLKEIALVMKKNQVHVRVLLHRARLNLIKQLNPSTSSREIGKSYSAQENLLLL
ncbi:MAG: sigma-70 family RNA polymerase sigma factor [Candidatus Aminicenantes bacterium]|nr:MAG: sigma-70 family RNA polymerase sigma factor [Candidatus Aminicenantes bacterium]